VYVSYEKVNGYYNVILEAVRDISFTPKYENYDAKKGKI